jgi:hypothetical protein
VSGCKGKGAAGSCPGLGTCGGDPTGLWQVIPDESCSFPVASRMGPNYDNTRGYFQTETGAMQAAASSGAWCWDLSFDKDGALTTPKVPYPNIDGVVSGTVEFLADQSYIYTLNATSISAFHIARSCLGVNGANLGPGKTPTTCAILAQKMNESIPISTTTYMTIDGSPSFKCSEAGDGCDCTFVYSEQDATGSAVGDKGTWVVDAGKGIIHHYSISGQGNFFETSPTRRPTRDATFCVKDAGETLELSGANGTPLALKVGARTLTLKRVHPADDGGAGAGGTGGATGGATGTAGAGGSAGAGGASGSDGGEDAGDAAASDAAATD